METATVFRFRYGLKKNFILEASMTPAKASFSAMGIGFERPLAVQERNESEMVHVRRTMPMLLQFRCGDKVQIKANQGSYGFLLLWCGERPAEIALNVAHPVDPKLLSSHSAKHSDNSDIRCLFCFNLHVDSQTVDFDTWQMTHGDLCANLLLLCYVGLWVYLRHPSLKNVLHCCFREETVW